MQRPVGGDSAIETYLLSIDEAVSAGLFAAGQTPPPVSAWTGAEWTWTWRVSREPFADLVLSVRPFFFPSGANEAEFRELRTELFARVWDQAHRDRSSTMSYFAARVGRDEIENRKPEDLLRPVVDAFVEALPDLIARASSFPESVTDRVDWLANFKQELASRQQR